MMGFGQKMGVNPNYTPAPQMENPWARFLSRWSPQPQQPTPYGQPMNQALPVNNWFLPNQGEQQVIKPAFPQQIPVATVPVGEPTEPRQYSDVLAEIRNRFLEGSTFDPYQSRVDLLNAVGRQDVVHPDKMDGRMGFSGGATMGMGGIGAAVPQGQQLNNILPTDASLVQLR